MTAFFPSLLYFFEKSNVSIGHWFMTSKQSLAWHYARRSSFFLFVLCDIQNESSRRWNRFSEKKLHSEQFDVKTIIICVKKRRKNSKPKLAFSEAKIYTANSDLFSKMLSFAYQSSRWQWQNQKQWSLLSPCNCVACVCEVLFDRFFGSWRAAKRVLIATFLTFCLAHKNKCAWIINITN